MNRNYHNRCFSGILLTMVLIAFTTATVRAEGGSADEGAQKTLSPYFLVMDEEAGHETLPLKSTSALVDIAGVIADVKVTQVYRNEGKSPIEAVYVFPGSTRASVYGMRMTIGERVREARISERQAARKEYEKAREEGKSASLLEQQRPNVFQMNVANIMPGDEIKVELSYTETIVPTDSVYEFVYPAVVGPRYTNQPEETAPSGERWVQNPYLGEGIPPSYAFDMKVSLSTCVPIQDMYSPSHKISALFDGKNHAGVSLDGGGRHAGNRDFILRYRLQGGEIESGLLLYEGKEENFFLLTMEPPERVKTAKVPPREFIYIVDVSGSMYGFPLDTAKKLIKDLVKNMRPVDRFNVLLFAAGSQVLSSQSLPATPENVNRAIQLIDSQNGGGGTELLPALRRALRLPRDENSSRTIVIATDGYVNVEAEAFELIRNSLNNSNVFAFGIGSGVNRFLIEGMARAGQGEPFVVTEPGEAASTAAKFRKYIETPVLSNIEIDYGKFKAYDIEPPSIPDVLAERPVVVFGKWKGRAEGRIAIKGFQGDRPYENSIKVSEVKPANSNSGLRYLWARKRIQTLGDYNQLSHLDERKLEITNLGLKYNLLTAYTSFVAVDNLVRNTAGEMTSVRQPLPLPEGVSKNAVGGSVPTTPEPETYLLMAVLGLMFLWMSFFRRGKSGWISEGR